MRDFPAVRVSPFIAVLLLVLSLAGCAGAGSDMRADVTPTADQTQARNRAQIRLELAAGYFQQGQPTVALEEIRQSLAADPNFADAYNLRALIHMRLNDNRAAEDNFRRALQLNPRDGNILHNYAWLMCQQDRFPESTQLFRQAVASPQYADQAKSYMALGLCQSRAGQKAEAERSLMHSYELDAANPITGYQLAQLFYQRGDYSRAQFYIRRINNSDRANAESLWLGMKIERRLENRDALLQLGLQLKRRFASSREAAAYDRGAWDE